MAHSPSALRENELRPSPHRPERTASTGARAHEAGAVRPHRANRADTARRLSVASAVLILVGGYVHLCLYRHGYRFIPKIGVSFLLQAVSSVLLAGALLVRGARLRVGTRSVALSQLTRLSAIGLSLGTLAALGIAHTPKGLFQFHEMGLRPAPQTLVAIVAEALAALLLSVAMFEGRAGKRAFTAAVASPAPRATRDAA
jgi:hypothetical protein